MITLTVTSFNGTPVANLACSFDELGGCIGRAETNKLILPDPERTISRVQAQILFRAGRYALAGRGTRSHLVVNSDTGRLVDTDFAATDRAAAVCPVGVILKKRVGFAVPIGQRTYDRQDPLPHGRDATEPDRQRRFASEIPPPRSPAWIQARPCSSGGGLGRVWLCRRR